jgi:tetratricopeptide (TPR) repeat protein
MSNRIAAHFALVVALSLGAQQVPVRKGQELFQRALVKERAEGKLEEAIQLYQQVIREFASDRALAAKAWLQAGRCYQKLGKPEARKVYERILRDYADQREAAKQARRALRDLRPPGAPPSAKVDAIKGSGA